MSDGVRRLAQIGEVQVHRVVAGEEVARRLAASAQTRPSVDGPGSRRCAVFGPGSDTKTTFLTCEQWVLAGGARPLPDATDGALLQRPVEQVVFVVSGRGQLRILPADGSGALESHPLGAGDCIYIEAFQAWGVEATGESDLVGITWAPTAVPADPVRVPAVSSARGTGWSLVHGADILEVVKGKTQLRPEIDLPDMGRCVVFGRWDERTARAHNITTVYFEFGVGSQAPGDGKGFLIHNVEQCEYIIRGHALILYSDQQSHQPVATYELSPGSHFYHDAFLPHKFIVLGDEPVVGISFTPTGGYRDTWKLGDYVHPGAHL